jgi:hypothetical protein
LRNGRHQLASTILAKNSEEMSAFTGRAPPASFDFLCHFFRTSSGSRFQNRGLDDRTVAIGLPARADAAGAALTRGLRQARDPGRASTKPVRALVIGPSRQPRLLRQLASDTTEGILDANLRFAVMIAPQGTAH